MKILILALAAIFGMTIITPAQKPTNITLRHNQQKSAGSTGLTIKFVSVVEDSRCPEGVQCVWAGNAKIQVKVTNARGSEILTMNTGAGPKGDQYGGYAINLINLEPGKPQHGKLPASRYTATFSITRLTR